MEWNDINDVFDIFRGLLKSIRKECDVLQRLESAFVIRYYGCFEEGDYFYMVTELAPNGDLGDLINVLFFNF